jgi:hypothetical protein
MMAATNIKTVHEEEMMGLRYVAVIVKPNEIVEAFKEGERLLSAGIVQLAFLPGQEVIAHEWERLERSKRTPSVLTHLLSVPPTENQTTQTKASAMLSDLGGLL